MSNILAEIREALVLASADHRFVADAAAKVGQAKTAMEARDNADKCERLAFELKIAQEPAFSVWNGPSNGFTGLTHELKCWPGYYQTIVSGQKRFELRQADRSFAAGDRLRLREWDPATGAYTGHEVVALVTCCLWGGPWLPPGIVCMGIELIGEPAGPAKSSG